MQTSCEGRRLARLLTIAFAVPIIAPLLLGAALAAVLGREPELRVFLSRHAVFALVGTVAAFGGATLTAVYARRQFLRVSERYQEALRIAREAREAREQFLVVASHELKTPLTSLRLQLGMALRTADGGRAAGLSHVSERLERADRQAERLSQLVNGLLASSRSEGAGLQLAFEEVDLAAVAREEVERAEPALNRAGCMVTVSAEEPVTGRWDRARLREALGHLLANAVKYGCGKPVEVAVAVVGLRARVTVRDHGIGIPQERQARLFERFERAAPVRHYGGFGLGLWTVRRIVRSHEGCVVVESRPGEGATFILELPRWPEASRASRSVAASTPRPGAGKIATV